MQGGFEVGKPTKEGFDEKGYIEELISKYWSIYSTEYTMEPLYCGHLGDLEKYPV